MRGRIKAVHENLTYKIIGAAMTVHNKLGPGYREEIYQRSLEQQLTNERVAFQPQEQLPIYESDNLLGFYIPDFIVEEKVILEIKAFATLHQKYLGQVITYLNHTGLPIGLLINFGARSLQFRRIFPSPSPLKYPRNHQWIFVPDWLKSQKQQQQWDDIPF
ncbi:GxxExxY protein [Dapis sp. BLCC M229]|uniref:GxxExxY protein n=1 Tax=Dapis sp. BLCC M229 TaxID=3400188 RepID=UPI003CF048D8